MVNPTPNPNPGNQPTGQPPAQANPPAAPAAGPQTPAAQGQTLQQQYQGMHPFAKFLLWTTGILGTAYMALCAAPKHLGYSESRNGNRPAAVLYDIDGNEIRFRYGRSGRTFTFDPQAKGKVEQIVEDEVLNAPATNTLDDKAIRAIRRLQETAGSDGHVSAVEVGGPGSYSLDDEE